MLTTFDKAIAALLPGLLLWLNQRYGIKFDTSPETMTALATIIGVVLVYFVPNKPGGGPGSQNYNPPLGAILLFVFLGIGAHDARATDILSKLPTPQCDQSVCSGPYLGVTLTGVGSNLDILGSGINGSIFAGGGMIGVNGGYQFWNGKYFVGVDLSGNYDAMASNVALQGNQRYMFTELVRFGMAAGQLFNSGATPSASQGPINIPTSLQSAFVAPFVEFGPVQRPYGNGWGSGAGASFTLGNGWNLVLDYLYVNYNRTISDTTTVKGDNFLRLQFNRMF